MSKKYKKFCTTLNFIEHLVTGCSSLSAFAFLIGIPLGLTSSAIGFKICAIAGRIKKYKSIIKKKEKEAW